MSFIRSLHKKQIFWWNKANRLPWLGAVRIFFAPIDGRPRVDRGWFKAKVTTDSLPIGADPTVEYRR